MIKELKKSFNDAFTTIIPVVFVVFLIALFINIKSTIVISFLFSSLILIIGSALFTFGAELSLILIGNKIGKNLVKSNKISLILVVSFIIGTVITIAEPDLIVLAEQITSLSSITLILLISLGVGLCTLLAAARSLFSLNLNVMLFIGFIIIFFLVFYVPSSFIPFAFDSGGVTTGTMSIPFLITLGIGLVSNRIDKKSKEDSFGLISLASTGPIIMVLLLGLFFNSGQSFSFDNSIYENFAFSNYITQLVYCFKTVILAVLPIIIVFLIYSLITKNVNKREIHKIILGLVLTIIGLTLFILASNVGFLNMGYYLGTTITLSNFKYVLIPIIMILAFFIAIAEPAVIILIDQIKVLTEGSISEKSLKLALALGVSIAAGLSVFRVFTGTPFFYYAIFGYGLALLLTFFIPKVFTAIAFDVGGATGGSLTTTFLLPISIGACSALGGNIYQDAFGLASLVSLIPIITIEMVGVLYQIKSRIGVRSEILDDSIIEYDWEVRYG